MASYEVLGGALIAIIGAGLFFGGYFVGMHSAQQMVKFTLDNSQTQLAKPVETIESRSEFIPPEVFMANGFATIPENPVELPKNETIEQFLSKYGYIDDEGRV